MARGADPLVRYAVLGTLGWVGWNWAGAQPAGSWARHLVDQARGAFNPTTARAAPAPGGPSTPPQGATPTPGPAPSPAAAASAPVNVGNTPVNQYNELEADGNWYQVTQWSDGSYTSWLIPPDQWAQYGIPTGGAGGGAEGPVRTWGPTVQKHDDGQWWLDSGYTNADGSTVLTDSQLIDPVNYPAYGIMPDGSAQSPFVYLVP